MRTLLLVLAGILFALLGYSLGMSGNDKWTILFLYLVAASSFFTLAILMIKNKTRK
ncbi:hypothetical protein [Bacillus sp. BHET2]|uniref:hypothetical protein n=1 Tax=Bacillus sp. BHET2 TaxID=2583818 RepID=UPI0014864025|nr:hypothetical protein [Bacillus sp. BHET2]